MCFRKAGVAIASAPENQGIVFVKREPFAFERARNDLQ